MIFILASTYSKAERPDSANIIAFRVVNDLSGSPVTLAHVINLSQREVAISDLLGYFKIPVSTGDTLSITSLGFFKQIIYCWGQFCSDSLYYTIRLKSRSYEIKELKFSWFSNYEKFLKGFAQLHLPVTKEEERIARVTEYFSRSISRLNLMELPRETSGGTFGKDWLTKQNEKLKEKLEKESKRRAIERKYSAGIVEALTGLTGNEVFWFMEYCSFTEDFLLKSSDYSIRLRILDKFKIYNQDKTLKDI